MCRRATDSGIGGAAYKDLVLQERCDHAPTSDEIGWAISVAAAVCLPSIYMNRIYTLCMVCTKRKCWRMEAEACGRS